MWWKTKERPRGSGQNPDGSFKPWFHGIISRHEAERLLAPRWVLGLRILPPPPPPVPHYHRHLI